MKVDLITKEDLEQFRLELLKDLKQAIAPQVHSERQWLRSADVRRLLKSPPERFNAYESQGSFPLPKSEASIITNSRTSMTY